LNARYTLRKCIRTHRALYRSRCHVQKSDSDL
jgi:hypothetical protein